MNQGAKRVFDNKDKTKWHMKYPDGPCKPTPNAASCSSSDRKARWAPRQLFFGSIEFLERLLYRENYALGGGLGLFS